MAEGNGLTYMRARYYDETTGRFITPDPIGLLGGQTNLYTYVGNSPVDGIDPQGTAFPLLAVAFGIGAAGGAIAYSAVHMVSNVIAGKKPWEEVGIAALEGAIAGGFTAVGHPVIGGAISAAVGYTLERIHASEDVNPLGLAIYTTLGGFASWVGGWLAGKAPKLTDWALKQFYSLFGHVSSEMALEAILLELIPRERIDSLLVAILRPIDPNEKTAPAGAGPLQMVTVDDEFHYTIYFENVITATAPAQEVFILDTLDTDLDWSTVRLTEVAFGDRVIAAGEDADQFHAQVSVPDYRRDVRKSWWVDITARLDGYNGQMRWTLRTLDPETGDLPVDPFAGFLPPNDDTGRGEGHVSFRIRPRADLANGTVITNQASIVFDTEASILTNQVWNTIGDTVDLALSKEGSADRVTVGDTLTYTLVAANVGSSDATGVIVTDILPSGIALAWATPSQGAGCIATDPITCALGTIQANGTATVTLVTMVSSPTTITLVNTAAVAAIEPDTNTEDNSASEITAIEGAANLLVVKEDSPDPVLVGETLTYTVRITNLGPSDAEGVVVTDSLPSGVTTILATSSQGAGCDGSSLITCDLGTIANGGDATAWIVVRPTITGTLVNTATVTSAVYDPIVENNKATASTVSTDIPGFKVLLPIVLKAWLRAPTLVR
jgi:RHS repeat-associated protein/uncharacterized repeat protein (TIGR01451 family)